MLGSGNQGARSRNLESMGAGVQARDGESRSSVIGSKKYVKWIMGKVEAGKQRDQTHA